MIDNNPFRWYDKYDLYNFYHAGGKHMNQSPPGKYAWTVKVGEKGQFVIPKEARDLFGINPGDTLLILGDVERGIAIPRKETFNDIHQRIFPTKEADPE